MTWLDCLEIFVNQQISPKYISTGDFVPSKKLPPRDLNKYVHHDFFAEEKYLPRDFLFDKSNCPVIFCPEKSIRPVIFCLRKLNAPWFFCWVKGRAASIPIDHYRPFCETPSLPLPAPFPCLLIPSNRLRRRHSLLSLFFFLLTTPFRWNFKIDK